jgi:hypothetical protein
MEFGFLSTLRFSSAWSLYFFIFRRGLRTLRNSQRLVLRYQDRIDPS